MSQKIVEIARLWTEAFKARRVPEELLAPNFVMENATTAVTERTYSGAAGIEQWFEDFFGVLAEGWRYDVDLTEIGDGCAVARITLSGCGRASGAPVDLSHWGVVWIADEKVTRAVGYWSEREALKAAGLSD